MIVGLNILCKSLRDYLAEDQLWQNQLIQNTYVPSNHSRRKLPRLLEVSVSRRLKTNDKIQESTDLPTLNRLLFDVLQ